ncbi:myosin-binding protein 2-like [Phragmites australis]|uniref:myosin-binding protein 2-like n=1 Tax=Phragmites australis TaxID=29695 RepID=UPI002D79647D|nr:myosin-binding protein 2-like [Phragmites australis]
MIRELFAVAARAALQWALASLLLANGAAFCLIAAAAARLRLGPPCILCARVHRLLCSSPASGGGQERDALRLLLCDAHLVAAAPAETEARIAPDRGDGGAVSEIRTIGLKADDPDKVSGMETHRVVSIGSEICEQDQGGEGPRATDGSIVARTSSTDGDEQLMSIFEVAPIVAHQRDDDDSLHHATTPELLAVDGDESLTVGQLVSALRAHRRELDALRAQLHAERRATAEAEEYQRQLEEQSELDREAARLAMQLVHESETEKHGLQRQLEACRVRAQLNESESAATDAGGEANGGGGNNYQSLVDFLPGSVYSSSPDLANLLKLYTEAGNTGGRRQRDDYKVSAIAVVAEEAEEEEVAVTESSGTVDATTAVVAESLHETVTETA